MERWSGKVAVVTGASAGIGLSTAQAFVRHGLIVVGLARRKDKMMKEMSSVKGPGKFYAEECDVQKETEVARVFELIEKKFKTIHILVNNAGLSRAATIADMTSEDLHLTINVNVMGLLYCTRQALKIMKKNKHEAHIVNVNSVAGHRVAKFPGVDLNVYPATKYAVTAITDELNFELEGEQIRCTSISPGLVKTEFFEKGLMGPSVLESWPSLNPEDVAASIVHVIAAPPHVLIKELTIKPLGQMS